MSYDERVVRRTDEEIDPAYPRRRTDVVERSTAVSPSGGELLSRAITLIFGIIQLLIVLRIVLLLLDAREANDLVRFILDASQVFVAPFIGILGTDALHAGGSVLDVAAIVAIVGWTVLELICLWVANLFRRETVV